MKTHARRRYAVRRRRALRAGTLVALFLVLPLGDGRASTAGLVAAYAFDEGAGTTVRDTSGNGNNGTISAATWTAAGRFGRALTFNGTSSWVTVPDAASLDLTTGMTLEAWVRPTSAMGTGWRTVVIKQQPSHLTYALYANTDTQRPSGHAYVGGDRDTRGTSAVPTSTWTHLATTYDGAVLRLYVNGVLQSSRALAGSMATSGGPLRIGGNSIWPEWFAGQIDEVRIYNRALSAAEIQSDMSTPVSAAPDTRPPTQPSNLVTTTTAGSATLTWSASTDDVGVSGYDVFRDGVGVGTTTSTSQTFSGLACATSYELGVAARDAAGNVSTRAMTTATTTACAPADTTPPTVALTAPTDGATVSSTVAVSADASDGGGVAGVQFRLDGVALGAEDTIAPYSVQWDTRGATNGVHTVTAVARDAAGNAATSTPVGVTVSNAADTDTSNAFKRVVVGPGLVDATVRLAVRTAADRVYLFAADDTAQKRGTGPGVIRAWRANQAGIPSGFTEVDGSRRPSASGADTLGSPDVRLDRSGVAHLVYLDKGTGQLVYRTFSTVTDTWGAAEVVATGVSTGTHFFRRAETSNAIVLDPSDVPHVVYAAGANVLYRNRSAGAWSSAQTIAIGAAPINPMLAADAAGDLHAAWLEDASPHAIRYAHRAAGTWSTAETVANTDVQGQDNLDQGPSIVVTPSGVPYVVYLSDVPASAVRVRHRTATGWVLDGPPGNLYAHTPQIYSRGGDVYVFLGHDAEIRFGYTRQLVGQPWTAYQPLTTLAEGRLDGSASVRWDPQRETNAGVIDVAFFDEDTSDDSTWIPQLYYMAVLPDGAPPLAPADTSPPTVSVTAPAAGSAVSGTTTVQATAGDDVGVAGVQFTLDGAPLGAEDTTAPYSVAWNSASVADGTHTLAAVARDAAGNRATSASVAVTVSNAAPPPQQPNGLVAAYAFDDAAGTSARDASGNANTGTLAGPAWTTGRYGGALSFDGSNDWVTVPHSTSLSLTAAMTLEAWVRPTELTSAWRTVVLKERTGYFNYALYANTDSARPSGHVYLGGDVEARGSSTLPLSTWTHLATTYDGTTLRLYVNGTQVASRAASGSIATSTGPLRIGGNSVWTTEFFRGSIDDVRVYARALSAVEIGADMNTPVA